MALDITGLIIIALFFIRGYTRGLIVVAFSVIAILLGILCALKLSQSLATWMLEHGYTTAGWAPMLSYLILFVGVVLVVRLIAKMLQKALETLKLGIFNKLAGGLLYGLLGAVLYSSILWIGARMNMFSPELVASSKTYYWLSQLAPWFFSMAGNLLPFAKDVFGKLQQFFDAVGKK
jgi:membrane protein required for colicin V production